MKKQLFRTTALVLAVIIMLCPLCVCFATGAEEVLLETLNISTILEWIKATFAAWGIYQDIQTASEAFDQWLLENLYEFLSTLPSIGGIQEWIYQWRIGYDPWGNYVGNANFLEDVQDFFMFVEQKYNLQNNTVLDLYEYDLDGMPVYPLPFYCIRNSNGNLVLCKVNNELYPNYQGNNPYVVFTSDNTESGPLHYCIIDTVSNNTTIGLKIVDENNNSLTTIGITLKTNLNSWGNTSPWAMQVSQQSGYHIYEHYDYSFTAREVHDNLAGTVTSSGVSINIGTINLPDNDPDYTQGDSITIVVDTPEYSEKTWPESISVDNLPAIVSTGSIRTLDLVSVFAPIKAFANTFSDGFDLMVQIVYNMPTEIVSIALTIMAAIAVFGTIKIFKEH